MVFDEETAPIVQKIFQWKIEGLSLPAIADRLDAMNAPNPEFQKYQVGVRTGNAITLSNEAGECILFTICHERCGYGS